MAYFWTVSNQYQQSVGVEFTKERKEKLLTNKPKNLKRVRKGNQYQLGCIFSVQKCRRDELTKAPMTPITVEQIAEAPFGGGGGGSSEGAKAGFSSSKGGGEGNPSPVGAGEGGTSVEGGGGAVVWCEFE